MEASTAETPLDEKVSSKSMAQAFLRTAERHGDIVAVRTKDDEVSWTWSDMRDRVAELAGGLRELGVGRGDTVAIMFSNRPEFHVVDLAVMMCGATPYSIYQTFAPNEIEYVVSDAATRVAIVEGPYLDQFLKARDSLPDLEHIVVLEGDTPEGTVSYNDVASAGGDMDLDAAAAEIEPDDVLTLIYTSGTTGPPKGVMLSHRNLITAVSGIEQLITLDPGARVISWLPAAHIAERAAHHYLPIVFGATVTTCPNPRDIIGFLPSVHPNWFFAVPRIWEKLMAALEGMVAQQPEEQREKAEAALAAARKKIQLEHSGQEVPDDLAAVVAKADEEMFSGMRKMLGLDEVVTVNVGAAPTPREVLEFFHAIGIELAELWGMSETCGAGTVNPPGRVKIGTVGPPLPGLEVKLAEDGEVLLKGGVVMLGYRNLPDKTAETIDDDGWLHTGDIGEIDDDGYLKIVDRKKELIINAAGKNMSPANIEGELKGSSALIDQAAAIGDRRPYNVALIVLDADYAPVWAKNQGIEDTSFGALANDERIRAAIQEGVDKANERLARVEQIKKFHIIDRAWEPGGDELTPTMKLKRKPIDKKYADEIEALYAK